MMAKAAKRLIAVFHHRGGRRVVLPSTPPKTNNKHTAKIAFRNDSCPTRPKSSSMLTRATRCVANSSIKRKWPTRSTTSALAREWQTTIRFAGPAKGRSCDETRPKDLASRLTRPMTIQVVAKANNPSSNRDLSRHPIDKPTAIVAVITSRPRRLNWNHRLGVLLAVSISGGCDLSDGQGSNLN